MVCKGWIWWEDSAKDWRVIALLYRTSTTVACFYFVRKFSDYLNVCCCCCIVLVLFAVDTGVWRSYCCNVQDTGWFCPSSVNRSGKWYLTLSVIFIKISCNLQISLSLSFVFVFFYKVDLNLEDELINRKWPWSFSHVPNVRLKVLWQASLDSSFVLRWLWYTFIRFNISLN